MKKPTPSPGRRPQRGALMIVLGVTLAMLIGFAGLAIDLGRFFVVKSELQNAMDACALAAASQLRPDLNTAADLTRAVAYGRVFTTGGTTGNTAIMNRANFQSATVDVQSANITFHDSLNGTYTPASTVNVKARYAKCELPLSGLPIYFMRVVDATLSSQTVSAMAVATLGEQICNVIPVGICPPVGGLQKGHWIPLLDTGTQGRFSWVDYSGGGGGTNEIRDAMTQPGACNIPVGTVGQDVNEAGKKTAAELGWNSRFGLYKNGVGTPKKETASPDFTGRAYVNTTDGGDTINWPRLDTDTAPLAFDGANGATVNFQTAQGGYLPFDGTTSLSGYGARLSLSPPEHRIYGAKDRRLVIAPIVADCTSAARTVTAFACTLMLNPFSTGGGSPSAVGKLEYLGRIGVDDTPCDNGNVTGPNMSVLVK